MNISKANLYTVKTNKIVKFPDLEKYITIPDNKNHLHFLTAYFMDKYGTDTIININIWKNEVFLDKSVKIKDVDKKKNMYGKQEDGSYKIRIKDFVIEDDENTKNND